MVPFLRRSKDEPGIPGQRRSNRAPVVEMYDEHVVGNLHRYSEGFSGFTVWGMHSTLRFSRDFGFRTTYRHRESEGSEVLHQHDVGAAVIDLGKDRPFSVWGNIGA